MRSIMNDFSKNLAIVAFIVAVSVAFIHVGGGIAFMSPLPALPR